MTQAGPPKEMVPVVEIDQLPPGADDFQTWLPGVAQFTLPPPTMP